MIERIKKILDEEIKKSEMLDYFFNKANRHYTSNFDGKFRDTYCQIFRELIAKQDCDEKLIRNAVKGFISRIDITFLCNPVTALKKDDEITYTKGLGGKDWKEFDLVVMSNDNIGKRDLRVTEKSIQFNAEDPPIDCYVILSDIGIIEKEAAK